MTVADSGYPVGLEADSAAPQNRLTVFFRIILAIPHFIIIGLLGIVAVLIYIISWFAILITGSYPAGMLRFMHNFLHWNYRVNGYLFLVTDKYPPFALGPDEFYPIRFRIEERIENRNRLTTFWPIRGILAIPHIIILSILNYVVQIVVFIAWIIALFTGSVPVGIHNFTVGYLRWSARAYAYMYNLVDEYPPFSLS